MRSLRALVAAAVLAGVSGYLFHVVTGTAAADDGPVTVTPPAAHQTMSFSSVDRVVVDKTRKRVLVSDPSAGRLAALNYDGSTATVVTGLPGVRGLALSADSSVVYAAVEKEAAIVALRADSLARITTYPVADAPGDLVLAGDRLWYSARSGSFGVLDLTTGEARLHGNQWQGDGHLLLAVSPANANLLAVTTGSTSGGPVGLFDTSGGEEKQIAYRDIDPSQAGWYNDLRFTGDGSQVMLAGDNGIVYLSAEDLTVTGHKPANQAVAMDVASTGWVAAADLKSSYTSVMFMAPGSSTSTHVMTLSSGNVSGLAWEPGGQNLILLTSTAQGAHSLYVVKDPSRTAELSLGVPQKGTRGAKFTIFGSTRGIPAGAVLTVRRTDVESPSGKTVGTITLNDTGEFTFTDTLVAGGKVGYTVSYGGSASLDAISRTGYVTVPQTTPAMAFTASKAYNYGTTATFTATLGKTYKNRVVEIWADPAGTDQPNRLLKRATVNSAGKVSAALKLTRSVTLVAKFTGDGVYAPRSITSYARTRVSAGTALSRHYKTAKSGSLTYQYFRSSANPLVTQTMTAASGRKVRTVVQVWSGGKWKNWSGRDTKLSTAGKASFSFVVGAKVGRKFRVQAQYIPGTSGDSLNYTTAGAWKYFTYTK